MIRALKFTGWMLSIGAALVVGSVLLLQSDPVSSWVGRRMASSLSGESLTIQVERVTGSWIRGLSFAELRLSATSDGGSGRWELQADSLTVGYRLLPLLKKTVSMTRVEGANVRFGLNLEPAERAGPGGPSQTAAPEAPENPWTVLAEVVRLRRGQIEVREAGAGDDGHPWSLSEVSATVRDLHTRPNLLFTLDTLEGRIRPSGREEPWGHLVASVQWGPDGITLDTLLLESPETRLRAGGNLPSSLQDPWREAWGLQIEADPVHLADLGPLLPPVLADSLRVGARAQVRFAGGVLTGELLADAGTGGWVEARGQTEVRGRGEAKGGLDTDATVGEGGWGGSSVGDLRLQAVDLRSWGLSDSPIRVDLDVSGSADSLRGSWEGEWSTRAEGVVAEGEAAFTPGNWPGWRVNGTVSYDPGLNPRGRGSNGSRSEATAEIFKPAWLGPSAFMAGFRWTGNGLSLDSLSARGEFRVDRANVGRVLLTGTKMAAQVEASGGAVGLQSLITSADSGQIRLAGVWEGVVEGSRVRVDSLRFAKVNLRSFLEPSDSLATLETRLSGTLRGWALRAPEGWTGEGTLLLDSTRVGAQDVSRGRILARGGSNGADLNLELSLGPGEVQGQMRVASSGGVPKLTVRRLTFQNLNLGALLGEADGTTQVTGSLEGHTAGFRPKEALAQFQVALDSSTVAGVSLAFADLDARTDSGRVNARLRTAGMGSTLEIEGNGSIRGAAPTFAAKGMLSHTRPVVNEERKGPRGTLHARFGLSGEGATIDSLQGSLWVEVDSARWEDVALETGRLDMHATGGLLHLDTLALESPAVSLGGGGMLPISSSYGDSGEVRLRGQVHQAERFAGWVRAQSLAVGEASFEAETIGTLEDMSLVGKVRVAGLLMDELQLQELDLSAQAQRQGGEGFTQGTATLLIDQLRRGPFPIRSLEAQASLEGGKDMAVSGSAVIDDSRDGTFALRLEDFRNSPVVRIEQFEFRADPDRWILQSPTGIRFEEGLETDFLSIRAGSQEIRARGRLARRGPLDLNLAVQDFRIGTLSDLMGFPALQGRVTGSLAFAGEGESPRLTGGLQGRLESRNAPPSEIEVTASYADEAMNLQAEVGMNGRRGFNTTATLPFRLSLADSATGFLEGEPLLLRLSADALPLAWAEPFLPEEMIRDLEGSLSGSVSLRGPRGQPVLDGALAMRDAGARWPALGVRYERGRANLRFQGETIFIDTLAVRTGDGSLSATGTVGIPGLKSADYDIRLLATDLQAVRSAGVDATVSGDIRVAGKSLEPAVTGNVVVRRADLYLDELTSNSRVEAVVLTEEDYQELARVFGYQERSGRRAPAPMMDGLALDLTLDLRRASWLRQRSNPEMAVQFSGNLAVQKEPGDSVLLVGEVAAVPARSYVEQFGRRFSLARGNLVFQGSPEATQIDLRAEYEVPSRDNPDQPEVVIALDISGTPEDLRLELSSSPPLEASDMVSYLAVGRPADRTLGGGEGSLSGAGEALALGRLSGAVEAYAREEVGLDVVEIITDGTEGVVLLAGRYISPELYLGIRQPISLHRTSGEASDRMSDPELEVELQAVRWLLLNLQAGGRSGAEFFVRSRISYE